MTHFYHPHYQTHTMLGSDTAPGILLLAVSDIFQCIRKQPTREFVLTASYMEIYNEVCVVDCEMRVCNRVNISSYHISD